MYDAIATAKRAMRAELRERRQRHTDAAREAAAQGIQRQLDTLVDSLGVRSLSCDRYNITNLAMPLANKCRVHRVLTFCGELEQPREHDWRGSLAVPFMVRSPVLCVHLASHVDITVAVPVVHLSAFHGRAFPALDPSLTTRSSSSHVSLVARGAGWCRECDSSLLE